MTTASPRADFAGLAPTDQPTTLRALFALGGRAALAPRNAPADQTAPGADHAADPAQARSDRRA